MIDNYVKPGKAVEMINESVKKATCNIITSIISPGDINAATDIVLADAVYFKGAWLSPFNSNWDEFNRLDGRVVSAQFMYHLDHHPVSITDGFKVLKLRYKNGRPVAASPIMERYSMFVFLPDKRGGIATMVDVITASPGYLRSVLPGPEKLKLVSVKLPKFQVAFDWDLGSDLRRRLGLSLPFSTEVADLRDVCEDYDGRPTILSKFAHSAVVKVSEAGTGAAATAAVPVRSGGRAVPDTVEFVTDHPFTFLIMEERSGVIVFAGHVMDPTK